MPHVDDAAVTAPVGNRAVLPVGPYGPPCLTPAGRDPSQAAVLPSLGAREAFSL